MDFTPNNPNLVNPGASFTEAFGRGMQTGLQQQQLAQQKQLAMASLGENQRQFDLMQQLRDQELDLNKQKTMADLSMMGAQQKLIGVQTQQQQFIADQTPKIAANQSYLTQKMADPTTFDPVNGASNFAASLADVPHPEALNPAETESMVNAVRTRNAQTQLGQSLAQQNAEQTKMISEFVNMGGDVKPYMIDPRGPITPQNLNMSAIGQANRESQVQLFQRQQDISSQTRLKEIEATGNQRLQYAQTLTQGRANTTDERSLVSRANASSQHVRDLIKAGANSDDINDAKTEAEHWDNELKNYRSNPQGGDQSSGQSATPTAATPQTQSSSSWLQGLNQGQ